MFTCEGGLTGPGGADQDDEGEFGEGNFQALFESIELDQIRRGVVEV